MKKYLLISLVAVVLLSSGGSVSAAVCDAPGGENLGYCPLEPIPGLTLGNAGVDLPTLLSNLFKILFSVGALMAVVMLVLGGISYMVSTVASVKVQAKERLQAALFGLLILAGSYLILITINPQLVVFNFTVPKTQYRAGTIQETLLDHRPSAQCTSSTKTATGDLISKDFIVYNTNKNTPCYKEAAALATSKGKTINDSAQFAIIVFKSADALKKNKTEYDNFVIRCGRAKGSSVAPIGNTAAGEIIFACLK